MDLSGILGAISVYFEEAGQNDKLMSAAKTEAELFAWKKQVEIDTQKVMIGMAEESNNREMATKLKDRLTELDAMGDMYGRKALYESGLNGAAESLDDPAQFYRTRAEADAANLAGGKGMSVSDRKTVAETYAIEQARHLEAAQQELAKLEEAKGKNSLFGPGRLAKPDEDKYVALQTYVQRNAPMANPETGYAYWMNRPNEQPAPFTMSVVPKEVKDPVMQRAQANRAAAAQQPQSAIKQAAQGGSNNPGWNRYSEMLQQRQQPAQP